MAYTYIAIGVRDIAASAHFWREGIGLAQAGRWPDQMALSTGMIELLLDATGEIRPAPGVEIGFKMPKADFDAALDRLSKLGAFPFRGPKDFGGPNGLEAAVRDPDGHVAVLYCGG